MNSLLRETMVRFCSIRLTAVWPLEWNCWNSYLTVKAPSLPERRIGRFRASLPGATPK